MAKKKPAKSTSQKFVPPKDPPEVFEPLEDIKIVYSEQSGNWHVFVLCATGYEEVSQQTCEEDAEDVVNYLARWKRGE